MRKIILFGLAVVFFICGCQSSDQSGQIPELKNPVGVEADKVKVVRRDLSNEVIYVGEIIPEIIEMSFPGSGNIGKMYVDVGDKVNKGKLLATLEGMSDDEAMREKKEALSMAKKNHKSENQIAEADIRTMYITLNQLKKDYKKEKDKAAKKQYKSQIITQEYDIKIAEKKLKQKKETQALELVKLQKEIQKTRSRAGSTTLTAPMDADVISIVGGSGYMVQGGDTAVRLAKMNSPRIKTPFVAPYVLEKCSSYVAVIGGKEYKVKAEKVEIPEYVNETGIGLPTETYFDFVSKDVSCKVGDFAIMHLRQDTSKNALTVPVNAIMKDDTGKYVYVDQNGMKARRTVTLGTQTPAYTEVLTGVREGEIVYVQS